MTYGWAILIIAIVLVAFFSLNLFKPYTFSPKASPGSCQILRPNGPGSNLFVSAVGPTCTTNEIPQYVLSIPLDSGVSVTGDNLLPTGSSARTLVEWFQVPANGDYLYAAGWSSGCATEGFTALGQYPSDNLYFWAQGADFESSFVITPHVWYFAAASYIAGANTITVYLDGANQTGVLGGGVPLNTQSNSVVYFGADACGNNFAGLLSNVQIYNGTLSPAELKALYLEGIGGAPTNIQNLVGWWPLNGNSNDYSGNGNNGVPTNVIFTSSWESGYTAP